MRPIDDSSFLIRTDLALDNDGEFVIAEEIKIIEINFTKFQVSTVFKEMSITDKLVQFNFDPTEKKCLLILENENN